VKKKVKAILRSGNKTGLKYTREKIPVSIEGPRDQQMQRKSMKEIRRKRHLENPLRKCKKTRKEE